MAELQNYQRGKDYWEKVPPTIDSMLGGFTEVSIVDVQASARFLQQFFKDTARPLGTKLALDCGAGIGRITKHLLLRYFDKVDLVEQNQTFLDEVHDYVGEPLNRKISNLFCTGLQNFTPEKGVYDVIWIQWVIGYLTDVDFVKFLIRCKNGLKENGVIVIKDNISSGELDNDHQDSSVTRPKEQLFKIFELAQLKILSERKQYKFPSSLYEVRMFALT